MVSISEKRRRQRKRGKPTIPAPAEAAISSSPVPTASQPKKRKRQTANATSLSAPSIVAADTPPVEQKDEEERELEAFLFGGRIAASSIPFGQEREEDSEELAAEVHRPVPSALRQEGGERDDSEAPPLFVIDKRGERDLLSVSAATAAPSIAASSVSSSASTTVWFDPDDLHHRIDISGQPRLRKLRRSETERSITATEFQQRLRSVYSNLHHPASWAQAKRTAGADEADLGWDVMSTSRGVRRKAATGTALPSGHLDIQALKDANMTDPAQGVIHAVQFHPTAPLLLTGGMDCKLRLFSIDGLRHHLAQTIVLPHLPITQAAFIHSASQLIATGRRRFLYTADLQTGQITKIASVIGRDERSWERAVTSVEADTVCLLGQEGWISVLDVRSKQWIGGMKGGASVRAGVYADGGRELWTVGEEEEVFVWDMRTRTCRERRSDPASLHNSAIALSPPSSSASSPLVAIGNRFGIVSLYPSTPSHSSPSPVRTLTSLTTAVDSLLFNPSGELLLSASRRKMDSLSLFHVGSGTVVSNWPTSRTPLHYVTAVDFSSHSGFLAVGNDRGRVLLYRLKHYADM